MTHMILTDMSHNLLFSIFTTTNNQCLLLIVDSSKATTCLKKVAKFGPFSVFELDNVRHISSNTIFAIVCSTTNNDSGFLGERCCIPVNTESSQMRSSKSNVRKLTFGVLDNLAYLSISLNPKSSTRPCYAHYQNCDSDQRRRVHHDSLSNGYSDVRELNILPHRNFRHRN